MGARCITAVNILVGDLTYLNGHIEVILRITKGNKSWNNPVNIVVDHNVG